MLPSILEKLSFGIAAILLFQQHRLALATLGFGIIDLIFGALFIAAYAKTDAG
jgi:hypothetical protein